MPIDFTKLGTAVKNVNTGNLGDDPDFVAHLSNSMQKRKSFGKAWEVGDQGTVFYPFKWYPDASMPAGGSFKPHMCAYFGHKVSVMKLLGTTFLRSLSCIDESGQVVGDGDLAYQFSRIAGLLVTAQKEKELADLNSRDWSVLGNSAYQAAYKKIEDAYDTKENMNAKRPLIGRLTVLKLTEVVYVAMDPNSGKPIFDDERKQKTGAYIQELSENRLSKLSTLANDVNTGILAQNPGLVPEVGELYFLEVLYNFTSAKNSKAEAGRAEPAGVALSLTIKERNPALKPKLDELLKRIPAKSDEIAAHTYNLSPMPDEVLRTKLQSIMFESTPNLPFLQPEDKERLVKNAQLFDYLRIAPKEDAELNNKMAELLGHPVGQAAASSAPTLNSIMGADAVPDYSKQQVTQEALNTLIAEDDGLLEGGSSVDLNPGGVL